MNTLYLVRHAHAQWTPDENRPLSARGHRDAQRVADVLRRYPIRAIYSSPYRRAYQTIVPLAAQLKLPIGELADLRERELGDPAGQAFLEAVETTWQSPSFAHPEGESNAAAQQRGTAVILSLQEQHEADHIVIATHGNLLALILQYFDPAVDFTFWKSLTMPDIYLLDLTRIEAPVISRLWQETSLP